jgi:hypothetical protein
MKFNGKKKSSKFYINFLELDTSPWIFIGFHGPLIELYLDSMSPFIICASKLEILLL